MLQFLSLLIICSHYCYQISAQSAPDNTTGTPATNQLPLWAAEHDESSQTDRTGHGSPVPSETASLRVGPKGPILMSDANLVEKLTRFTTERIPERVIFGKGAGAHGFLDIRKDISQYTDASVLTLGKRTPCFCRFATTTSEHGTPDTYIDVRGLSCKFYSEEGNWDLVTITGLVSAIREPALFPDLIHAHKPNPVTNSALDSNALFDFRSLRNETLFMTLTGFSDLSLPDGYRFMDTSAIHTYKLINSAGDVTLCRFHLVSNQGVKNLTLEEATILAGSQPDYATADLYNAIAEGNFPSWTLNVQLMTLAEAKVARWDPLDPTKIWLQEDFPYIPIAVLELNDNPKNYFAEVEMVAYSPANLVPGIELTPGMPDVLAFAYRSAQVHRLGPNFEQLPINRPRVNQTSYKRDGQCVLHNGDGAPNYYPNSFNGPRVSPRGRERGFGAEAIQGIIDRYDTKDRDDFTQPRMFLKRLRPDERQRLVSNIAVFLSQAAEFVRERMFRQFRVLDTTFEREIREAVNAALKG